MAGSQRNVSVRFTAEVQNFVAAMKAASKATEETKKASEDAGKAQEQAGKKSEDAAKAAAAAAKKHKDSVENVGAAAGIAGAAVVAGVGLAVKSYADFDKQMSSVDAATHETAGNMALLRQAAIDAGADTAFSAGEAAQGIEELAKAGVSTKDILAGGLNGSLALAAAGSLGVGDAAEIAASALTQFKLSGDQVPHVADLLAAGAGKAQGSVQDLGMALNQSGLVAASTGLTIEETTAGLSAFASAGLVGADAGTSFKSMLQRLTPQSLEAKNKMDELGISAYDAQGNFVGLSKFSENLKTSMKDLTPEARNAAMGVIFGSDAVRAANVLYEQGGKGIADWTAKVNDAGYAADTAARMQDNLAGDLERLGGSFDTVLIQSGSGANEVLRGLVQGLEGLVDTVGKVPAPVLAVGTGLAAVVGGAALVGGALITVIPKIKETKDAFNDLAPAGGRARGALESVGKAAGTVGALVAVTAVLAKLAESDYMSKIDTGMGGVNNALQDVAKSSPNAATALDSIFKDRDGGKLISGVTDLESAIKRTFNRDGGQQFNDWGESLVNSFTGVKGSSQILEDSFKRLDDGLAGMVSSGNTDGAAKAFESIKKAAADQGVSVDELVKKFPAYGDALKQAESDAKAAGEGGDKASTGMKAVGEAAAGAKPSAEDLAKELADIGLNAQGSVVDIDKFAQALLNSGLITLSARDAARNWSQALLDMGLNADGTGGRIGALGTAFDNTTEQGIKNQAMFDGVAQAGIRNAEALAKAGAGNEELQGNLTQTYNGLIAAAGQFGITGGAAEELARKVLGVPKNVPIEAWVKDYASQALDGVAGKANALDGKKVTVEIFEKTWATRYSNGTMDVNNVANGPGGAGGTTEYATGGRLPGFAGGGQLPTSGPGTGMTDGFLGISSAGVPLARVDAGEWIIKRSSSARYNRELAAINAGTFPKLPGFAGGGRAYAAQASAAGAAGGGGIHIDLSGAQFTALDPVQLRRDIVDDVTYKINSKSGVRVA